MPQNLEARFKETIVPVADFPKEGVTFRDITPLLSDPELLHDTIEAFYAHYEGKDVSAIAGPESRGFLFGVLLAQRMNLPFVPIRKPGKLPRDVYRQPYELEYGTDELQIHRDALSAEDNVVIVDDLLATGGTAWAAAELVAQTGARVEGSAFVIELPNLEGRKRLGAHAVSVYSLVQF